MAIQESDTLRSSLQMVSSSGSETVLSRSSGLLPKCECNSEVINKLNCDQFVGEDEGYRKIDEITPTRTYITSSDCWNSSFEGRFFWRKGVDAPKYWAADDPLILACKSKPCTPVGIWQQRIKGLSVNDIELSAERMYRWRYESDCGMKSFFVSKKDRHACLKDKNILIVGDNTLRQIFHLLANTVLGRNEKDVRVLDCDPSEAFGCYDCPSGCKGVNSWQRDHTTYFKSLNLTINFSWKPKIFTLDDRLFLDKYLRKELPRPDLVFLHKASHEAFQRIKNYQSWTEMDYENYMRVRSRQMVEAYNEAFIDVPMFWRAPFYQSADRSNGMLNKLMRQIEDATRPHLVKNNIRVLETSTLQDQARGAPKLYDAVSPHEFVNFVLLDSALSTVCEHK